MLLIPLTPEHIEQIFDYVGEIVGDFLPLIVVFFGITIGFWVVNKILHRKED